MDNKKIGVFIASKRKEKGMTQKQLADQIGVTNKAISKWETGEGYPDITFLPILGNVLEVNVDEILAGNVYPTSLEEEKNLESVDIEAKVRGRNFRLIAWIPLMIVLINIYVILFTDSLEYPSSIAPGLFSLSLLLIAMSAIVWVFTKRINRR